MTDFIEDLIYCKTCKDYTNQIIIKYHFHLRKNFVFKDTHIQKFRCSVCQRTNERTLYFCDVCHKYTSQTLISEDQNFLFTEDIGLKLTCKVCGQTNEATRHTKEYLQRLENARDEKNGVYCTNCLAYRKQELIDKFQSDFSPEFDLTTYRCKTCRTINYGTKEKVDIQ